MNTDRKRKNTFVGKKDKKKAKNDSDFNERAHGPQSYFILRLIERTIN